MPLAIVLGLAVVLAALALVLPGDGDPPATAPPLRPDPVARIIARVEAERGVRFRTDPAPRTVTPAQARREGVASLDRDYPPARRRSDADLFGLLGLLEPGTDLGAAIAETFEQGVAGYYDPRSGRMRIVAGAQTANRVLYEMTVAHELTHALEDQRFGFDLDRLAAGDDAALAYTALIEGSATALMYRYADARFEEDEVLGGVLASAFAPTGDLPPFLQAQLLFPYTAGETFVERLLAAGGGRWTVVDAALRFRPPASTEQVMHPGAYLRVAQPVRVGVRDAVAAFGAGWSVAHAGTLGEWLTGRVLARAGGAGSGAAAAGWGGDRYALLGRGEERALVARWRWDTARDVTEFVRALRAWARDGLPGSERVGTDAWRTPGGAGAIARRGGAVTLVLAPELGLALRSAGR